MGIRSALTDPAGIGKFLDKAQTKLEQLKTEEMNTTALPRHKSYSDKSDGKWHPQREWPKREE